MYMRVAQEGDAQTYVIIIYKVAQRNQGCWLKSVIGP